MKPIAEGLSTRELTHLWAAQGIALLLCDGSEYGFGDSCLQSATLRWPPALSAE